MHSHGNLTFASETFAFLALVKTAIGVAVGGVVGTIMFRRGKGSRAASIATGVGVAAGSTYERIVAQYGTK